MTDPILLQYMWALLAGAWGIATALRLILAVVSWPRQRAGRAFGVLAHIFFAVYFVWRLTRNPPLAIQTESLIRNSLGFVLVAWSILDCIAAIVGTVNRRARLLHGTRHQEAS